MRRSSLLGLATLLWLAGTASATENVVTKVTTRAEGPKTVIVVHGSATPSFTAYRLERPARVVVDVADGRLGADELRAGPIDVDTWAVGQIAAAQYADDATRTARVMIGFKRPASYDVKAVGHDLVITVTPDEAMPADAVRADAGKVEEARKRRVEAETQTAATEQRRQKALAAEQEANLRAAEAGREAEAARTRAQAAKDELDRMVAARRAEELRLGEALKRTSTASAASLEARAESERLQREQATEQARLTRLRAEAQALLHEREAASKKLADTQAAARKAAEERQARLEEIEQAARARQAASESARVAEEHKAQARAEEAARLAQAAAAAERARSSETASREAERRAADAVKKAQAAESTARTEQDKLNQLRAEARQQSETARAAQGEVERARGELGKLMAAQEAERGRVEAARREATHLEADRAQALERAEHAAALASGSMEKIAQAEREARRIADERAKESARLEAVRKETQAAADARQKELARLETARAEARRIEEARRAEEARLAQLKDDVRHKSDELAQQSTALQATQTELAHKSSALEETQGELQRKADELQRRNDELRKKTEAARAGDADVARARSELSKLAADEKAQRERLEAARREAARVQGELRKLDGERQAAEKLARAERTQAAAQSAAQSAEERGRIDRERAELGRQLAAERAELTRKLQAAQAEMARAGLEQQKKQAERARLDAELKVAQADKARLDAQLRTAGDDLARATAEQRKQRAEGAALDQRLQSARAELARIEETTRQRLAMVPTPARVAAPTPKSTPTPTSLHASKDALPMEKVAARVRDVRFVDDKDAERVVVDVSGLADASPDAVVIRADDKGAVLRIARTDLPKKLERTLDASAFAGPIRSVSTYADPDDASAVRVEVALADGGPHAQPKLVRDSGSLTWEFPRSGTRSLPPPKVAAYGASIPLQVAQATPAAARPGARHRSYSGRRMDLDFVNADIHNIMRLISDVGQINVVLSDDVKGTVTMHLRDVPWDQALDIILRSKGLGMQREGNLIRVAPQAVLEKELEQEVARQKAAVELKPLDTKLIGLSYADGAQVLPRVQELMSSRGRAAVDARTNQLIITDVAGNLGLIEDLVRNLDTQTPQVLIEARIVEARTTYLRDIGIQWGGNSINSVATGNPTGIAFPSTVGLAGGATDSATNTQGVQLGQSGAASPNFVVNMPAAVGTGSGGALGVTLGSVNGAVNINLRLSSLENTGNVRIISAPKIMTLDNIEASIEQGVAIPISVVSAAGANTVFVDAKLNLTVKPHVTNEGSIVMNVQITRNEPDFVNVGARGDPTILKKQAKTEMLVRDGDTAVIGGIYTRNSGLAYTKVPWFADIPVIGWLFKNRRENDDRTELLIFITPRIVNRAVVAR